MKVKSQSSAILFLLFVNAPNVGGQVAMNYFAQRNLDANLPKNASTVKIPPSLPGKLLENGIVGNLQTNFQGDTAAEELAIRIIFNTNPNIYQGTDEERIDEFIAIVRWLRAVRTQGLPDSIQQLVTKYSNAIVGNPVEDVKRAISLLREIKATVQGQIVVDAGDEAVGEFQIVNVNSKKKALKEVLTLGNSLPIIAAGDGATPIFNTEFQSYGAFKFSVKTLKDSKLAIYLIEMFDDGLVSRARFTDIPLSQDGTRRIETGNNYQELKKNQWALFSQYVKRSIPEVQSKLTPDQTRLYIGWSPDQVQSFGQQSYYTNRTKKSSWSKLSDGEKKDGYATILANLCDFDCPMIYTILVNGTFARDYVLKYMLQQYCSSVFCKATGKLVVEGLSVTQLGKNKYIENPSIVNVCQEVAAFSRWLTILLDIDDGYETGLSPFTNQNLERRANFLDELKDDLSKQVGGTVDNPILKGQDIINDIGYFDDYEGESIQEKFREMVEKAASIIEINEKPSPDCFSDEAPMAGTGGGSKLKQSGGGIPIQPLPLEVQKQNQLNQLTILFLEIMGDARSFIAPLTNPENLIGTLQRIETGLRQTQAPGTQPQPLIINMMQKIQTIKGNWVTRSSQASAAYDQQMPPQQGETRQNYFSRKQAALDIALGPDQRSLFFQTINLYSILVSQNRSFDFLGVDNLFEEITSKINNFVYNKSNPETDVAGNPYQGFEFRLLNSLIEILILFNNTHIYQEVQGGNKYESLKGNTLLKTRLESVINLDSIVPGNDSLPNTLMRRNGLANLSGIDAAIQGMPGYNMNKQLIQYLFSVVVKNQLETSNNPVSIEVVKRSLSYIVDNLIPVSQSNINSNSYTNPQIKLLLALSGMQSFLRVNSNTDRLKDPIFMLLFANKDAIRAGTTIDFAWENWQNNKIMQRFYMILQRINAFENTGIYTPLQQAVVSLVQGGKKNKTKKKRKKKKKTRKAKKKRQNKKRKTRVKRDKRKRKRKKTRGRKKKN